MNQRILSILAGSMLVIAACDTVSQQAKQIEGLEQRLAAQYSNERSDSLVNLYKQLVKENPENHKANLYYLTRAAEIQFTKRNEGVAAARWLNDAMLNHSKDQDATETMALYARIYNNSQYKSATTWSLDPKDISAMQRHLLANKHLLDSALLRLDRQMQTGGQIKDKAAALKFIEVAEGYAAITDSPDKYADLLSKAGGLAKTIEEFNKALVLYHRLSERLPDHPKARTALFLQGFIYENDIKNLEKAKTTYEEFLAKYPDDTDYADDVKVALSMLGKNPEDIIKDFKQLINYFRT